MQLSILEKSKDTGTSKLTDRYHALEVRYYTYWNFIYNNAKQSRRHQYTYIWRQKRVNDPRGLAKASTRKNKPKSVGNCTGR